MLESSCSGLVALLKRARRAVSAPVRTRKVGLRFAQQPVDPLFARLTVGGAVDLDRQVDQRRAARREDEQPNPRVVASAPDWESSTHHPACGRRAKADPPARG